MRVLAGVLLAALAVPAQETKTEAALSGSALIDRHLKAKWEEQGLKPAKRSDDSEFLRRAYLDVVGVIPSLEETEKFLADRSPKKRETLVASLVKDERYAEHWADVWSGVIVGFDKEARSQSARNQGAVEMRDLLEKNVPYDRFARTIMTASGAVNERYSPLAMMADKKEEESENNGLASYIVRQFREAQKDLPKSLAGKLSRAFLGIQIQCAQCHDHPFDKWTQEEFYGMASFFTELRVRRDPKDTTNRSYHVEDAARGPIARRLGVGTDLSIPDSKSGPIKPSFILNKKGTETGVSRRESFAKLMTEPDNLQFAKMAVNRYWAHFFGTGIVNPVDDFNEKNKPSHPELLEDLAKDFIAHKYDLHWLIQALAGSEAYQLTSRAPGKDRDPAMEKGFALQRVRALAPEQIARSVVEAARLDEGPMGKAGFGRVRGKDAKGKGGAGDTQGLRLIQMVSQFRTTFDDDEGSESVDFAGTIPSALLMMNSPSIGVGTTANRLSGFGEFLEKVKSPEERVRGIFLTVLSRVPTSAELNRWRAHAARAQGAAGYEDLLWTLLNTSEFLFNH
jgi:hypothetical protein